MGITITCDLCGEDCTGSQERVYLGLRDYTKHTDDNKYKVTDITLPYTCSKCKILVEGQVFKMFNAFKILLEGKKVDDSKETS